MCESMAYQMNTEAIKNKNDCSIQSLDKDYDDSPRYQINHLEASLLEETESKFLEVNSKQGNRLGSSNASDPNVQEPPENNYKLVKQSLNAEPDLDLKKQEEAQRIKFNLNKWPKEVYFINF